MNVEAKDGWEKNEEQENVYWNCGSLWSNGSYRSAEEWWGRDMNGVTETDFILYFRMTRATFKHNVCFC